MFFSIKRWKRHSIEKKTEIFDLLAEYKELVSLRSDKVSKYLKNECYFKNMEEEFNDENDFEELKHLYFDLGHEFRQFVIEYNINRDLIKEKTINIFLKQKSFTYPNEEPNEEPINQNFDNTPTIDNKEENIKENIKEKKQNKQQEIIDDLEEEMSDLKEQIKINNKKQQETIDSLKQEIAKLKEQIKINKKQQHFTLITNILKKPTINNRVFD